jgi:exosortase/archaeosortase family protein
LRRKSLQATLLILGILAAIAGNLIRSFFLSCTANAKGVAAIQSWHDAAGWTILAFTAATVALLAWLLHKLEKALLLRYRPEPNRERQNRIAQS